MIRKKKVPVNQKKCEFCSHRNGEFFWDEKYETTRCSCRARHVEVDINLMDGCDFFTPNPDYVPDEKSKVVKPAKLMTTKPKRR